MKRIWMVILLAGLANTVIGQVGEAQKKDALRILGDIVRLKSYSYKYESRVTFPNGRQDHFKGSSFVSEKLRSMYSQTDISTLLLTPAWYVQADHINKRVSVLNLAAYARKQGIKESEIDVFTKGATAAYLDTVMLQYAVVKSVKELDGRKVAIEFGFPARLYLQGVEIVYDKAHDIPVTMLIRAYQSQGGASKGKGTSTIVTCSGYIKEAPDKVFNADAFFRVSNGKVTMRQFKNYKLTTLL